MGSHDLLRLVRRWWWLALLVPVIAAAIAYTISSRQEEQYRASATLLVTPMLNDGTVDYTAISDVPMLVETYRDLVRVHPVLTPVRDQLALPYDIDELADKVSVSTVEGTQLLQIRVSDPDPQRASDIANAVADRFSAYVAEQMAQSMLPVSAALNDEIAEVDRLIGETRQQIQELEQAPASGDPRVRLDELDALRARLDRLEESHARLTETAQNIDLGKAAARGQVTVTVPAIPPTSPYAPRVAINVLIAALLGLVVVAGVLGLLVYLGNAVVATPASGTRDQPATASLKA